MKGFLKGMLLGAVAGAAADMAMHTTTVKKTAAGRAMQPPTAGVAAGGAPVMATGHGYLEQPGPRPPLGGRGPWF